MQNWIGIILVYGVVLAIWKFITSSGTLRVKRGCLKETSENGRRFDKI